jgi:hypothetical protein
LTIVRGAQSLTASQRTLELISEWARLETDEACRNHFMHQVMRLLLDRLDAPCSSLRKISAFQCLADLAHQGI